MSSINYLNRNAGQDAVNLSAASQPSRRGLNPSLGASSGDDGLAVVSKFSPASRQLAARHSTAEPTTDPASPTGALQHAAGLLARIGELKSLHTDASASDADRATYQDEFAQLRDRLASLGLNAFGKERESTSPRPSPLQVSEPSVEDTEDTPTAADPGPLEFTDDSAAADTPSDLGSSSGSPGLATDGEASARLPNYSLQGTAVVPSLVDDAHATAPAVDDSESPSASGATDLASLDAGSIAAAQAQLAAQRAELDAAASSAVSAGVVADPADEAAAIADSAQADDITRLIRESMLLESSLALTAQANVHPESALQLLGTE